MKRDEIQSIYLATGNATEAEKFIKEIDGIPILTKHMVLKNEPYLLQLLEDMSWDQQALVEYVVIANSDYFLGVNPSSFSMNIAAKRHLRDNGLYSRPWKVGHDDGERILWGSTSTFGKTGYTCTKACGHNGIGFLRVLDRYFMGGVNGTVNFYYRRRSPPIKERYMVHIILYIGLLSRKAPGRNCLMYLFAYQ